MNWPPVAFFGFNRPDCTKTVFEAIRRYRPAQLFLIADGPRAAVPTDQARCEAVRAIMQAVDWPCEVRVNFAEQNMGCKKRMSSGIDWVFSQVEEAIFLEDDCVPSPEFFDFCAQMLSYYRDNPRIMHITGSNHQEGHVRGDGSYYFSHFIHVWGWASWRRAWQHYDVELHSWPQAKKENLISKVFPTPLEHFYWTSHLDRVHAGKIDTWDFQWVYACWRQNGVGIIPNANLISNIGAGPDATHTKGPVGSLESSFGTLGQLRHPSSITVDRAADEFTFEHHCGGAQMRRDRRLIARIRRRLAPLKRAVKALVHPSSKR